MELVNQTALPADVQVSATADGAKAGVLVAKATFLVARSGALALDEQDAVPIFFDDVPTELGLLPSDVRAPGKDAWFETSVLGAAYADGAQPTPFRWVQLQIGQQEHRLCVFGDRVWLGSGDDARASEPLPFVRMPLVWSRAHGGSADVYIDEATAIPVADQLNPEGAGFDAASAAAGLAHALGAAPGFPRLDYVRALPNLEHPSHLIRQWQDRPEPYCWAPLPATSLLVGLRLASAGDRPEAGHLHPLQRAHPELVRRHAPTGEPVVLVGCTPDVPLAFTFPPLRVHADYVIGARTGSVPLAAQCMVLLPEEHRFYVVYRAYFRFRATENDERSLRLRVTG